MDAEREPDVLDSRSFGPVKRVDKLPARRNSADLIRTPGYVVALVADDDVTFFDALEPAYAFARAARMAHGVHTLHVEKALLEVKFDRQTGRDVSTLYALNFGAPGRLVLDRVGDDRRLLEAFLAGTKPQSAHWLGPCA